MMRRALVAALCCVAPALAVDPPPGGQPDVLSVPPVHYAPRVISDGRFSVEGACDVAPDGDVPRVRLEDREPLGSAWQRLLRSGGSRGGIIEVSWDTETLPCDRLRPGAEAAQRVVLRGIVGPQGQLPRFYCRRVERQGTVPKGRGGGQFLNFSTRQGRRAPASMELVVENLHIDGYNTALLLPSYGHVVVRGNYIHHQLGNGISFNGLKQPGSLRAEFCGNEVAHSGRGNTQHGFYLHRGRHPDSEASVLLVDNLCHSSPDSSCFKSTANDNTLINNRFHQSLETDPAYSRQQASMLVDIVACASNLLRGNEFHAGKADPQGRDPIVVGVRNRKGLQGCDRPPYGSPQFNDPGYWESLQGAVQFRTVIENNRFHSSGPFASTSTAVMAFGTYPNRPRRAFGSAVLLETPAGWYERSRVYTRGNHYSGFDTDKVRVSNPPRHCQQDNCGPAPTGQPDPDLIEVGPGETID